MKGPILRTMERMLVCGIIIIIIKSILNLTRMGDDYVINHLNHCLLTCLIPNEIKFCVKCHAKTQHNNALG